MTEQQEPQQTGAVIESNMGYSGHLGIKVIRAKPTLRLRITDAIAAFRRRFDRNL